MCLLSVLVHKRYKRISRFFKIDTTTKILGWVSTEFRLWKLITEESIGQRRLCRSAIFSKHNHLVMDNMEFLLKCEVVMPKTKQKHLNSEPKKELITELTVCNCWIKQHQTLIWQKRQLWIQKSNYHVYYRGLFLTDHVHYRKHLFGRKPEFCVLVLPLIRS